MSNFVSMVEEHISESDDIIAKSDFSPEPFLGCQICGKKFFSGIAHKKHMASFHPSTINDTKNETTLKMSFEASPIIITSESGSDGVKRARSDSIENLNSKKFKSTNSMMSSPKTEIDFSKMIEDIGDFSDSKKVPMDIGLNDNITPDTSFTEDTIINSFFDSKTSMENKLNIETPETSATSEDNTTSGENILSQSFSKSEYSKLLWKFLKKLLQDPDQNIINMMNENTGMFKIEDPFGMANMLVAELMCDLNGEISYSSVNLIQSKVSETIDYYCQMGILKHNGGSFYRFLRNPCKDEIDDLINDTETKVDNDVSKELSNSKDDENLFSSDSELEEEENLPLPKFESTPASKKVQQKSKNKKKLQKHSLDNASNANKKPCIICGKKFPSHLHFHHQESCMVNMTSCFVDLSHDTLLDTTVNELLEKSRQNTTKTADISMTDYVSNSILERAKQGTTLKVIEWGKPWGWVSDNLEPLSNNQNNFKVASGENGDTYRMCTYCNRVFHPKDNKVYFLQHTKMCRAYSNYIVNGNTCKFCKKVQFMHGKLLVHLDKQHYLKIAKLENKLTDVVVVTKEENKTNVEEDDERIVKDHDDLQLSDPEKKVNKKLTAIIEEDHDETLKSNGEDDFDEHNDSKMPIKDEKSISNNSKTDLPSSSVFCNQDKIDEKSKKNKSKKDHQCKKCLKCFKKRFELKNHKSSCTSISRANSSIKGVKKLKKRKRKQTADISNISPLNQKTRSEDEKLLIAEKSSADLSEENPNENSNSKRIKLDEKIIISDLDGTDVLCTRCEMMVNQNHKKLCNEFFNLVIKNARGETKCYFCDMKFRFRNKAYYHIKMKHFSKKVSINCKKLSNETLIDEYKILLPSVKNDDQPQSQVLLLPTQSENVDKQLDDDTEISPPKKKVNKKLFVTPLSKVKKPKKKTPIKNVNKQRTSTDAPNTEIEKDAEGILRDIVNKQLSPDLKLKNELRTPNNSNKKQQQPSNVATVSPHSRQCNYCKETVPITAFVKHVKACQKAENFIDDLTCKICQNIFESKEFIFRHVVNNHHKAMKTNSKFLDILKDVFDDNDEEESKSWKKVKTAKSKKKLEESDLTEEIKEKEDTIGHITEFMQVNINDSTRSLINSQEGQTDQIKELDVRHDNTNEKDVLKMSAEVKNNADHRDCVYLCPMCRKDFGTLHGAQYHVEEFHRLTVDDMVRMNLRIDTLSHICPMCRKKFATLHDTQCHVEQFHRLPMRDQSRMNLQIETLRS